MFDFIFGNHMGDEVFIQYRARLLDSKRSDLLEAHLLLCPTCQLQLEQLLPPTAVPGLLQLCSAQ